MDFKSTPIYINKLTILTTYLLTRRSQTHNYSTNLLKLVKLKCTRRNLVTGCAHYLKSWLFSVVPTLSLKCRLHMAWWVTQPFSSCRAENTFVLPANSNFLRLIAERYLFQNGWETTAKTLTTVNFRLATHLNLVLEWKSKITNKTNTTTKTNTCKQVLGTCLLRGPASKHHVVGNEVVKWVG